MAYKRIAGRRFQNTETGEIISRRQHDKLQERKRAAAHSKERKAKEYRKRLSYQQTVSKYQTHQANLGNKLTKQQVRTSPEFKAAQKEYELAKKSGKKLRIKKAVINLGLREGIPFNVPLGQSDNVKAIAK